MIVSVRLLVHSCTGQDCISMHQSKMTMTNDNVKRGSGGHHTLRPLVRAVMQQPVASRGQMAEGQ